MADTANDRMTAAEAREHLQGQQTEEQLHKACVRWAHVQAAAYPALDGLFHVPNGGKMPKGTAGKLKGQGLKKGVPDLVLPVVRAVIGEDGRRSAGGLWIELKSRTGRLRDSQEWWRDFLLDHGHAWALCRSVGGFQDTVIDYLDGTFELSD